MFSLIRTPQWGTDHDVPAFSEQLRPESVIELTDEELAKVTGGNGDHHHHGHHHHDDHHHHGHHHGHHHHHHDCDD